MCLKKPMFIKESELIFYKTNDKTEAETFPSAY